MSLPVTNSLHTEEDTPKVAILVETTIPPVSRANLRMYWLARALRAEGAVLANMVAPSQDLSSRRSYFTEGIWMNQYPGFGRQLYGRFRLPVRIWHFLASILSVVLLELTYRRGGARGFCAVHAWNPLAGMAAVVAGALIRRPVFLDFTDFYSDIARTDMPLLAKPLVWLENLVLSRARRVFVVSESMREHLVSRKGLDPDKVVVVPDGTDAQTFRPGLDGGAVRRKLGLSEDTPLIVFHGDIKHDDGVDVLMRALALVLKSRPDARLLVLGGGGPYFQNEIRPLVESLGIAHAVLTPGWIPHQEVPAYLNACDIGAMTMRATLNHDNYLSFKLFEYWGCGLPVVVTRLKAIGRIVRDGENGLVCASEDAPAYAAAFLRLMADRETARRLGAAGRELVERQFDWRMIMKAEVAQYTPEVLELSRR
ncbi:GDP-mannose-dependent alpha-(1-6)-phosphatidylinositol monomannoside mannosyltransferase [Fundidesulfovibrio magnetotacticus]|uniref:GDP-mannose-dependent alpha-(1-6)-phosphatidylinositol monomannoside mannosyltransferase n=1 Tax=Fundidesulfovibrio magnetotacticus TaxID=2730080 RepID=A0A6V8LQT7_9BACT|nr:glycosyltransferase family 4 protein [Fundidesulfovibrio magnetotacticus]GFK92921.1 GDP-mannose-dependent alpha-(1-6)-phosphatidylinositol monomannoside mannosyltransferase [Fundidesulfovibrio magnetotacticus]